MMTSIPLTMESDSTTLSERDLEEELRSCEASWENRDEEERKRKIMHLRISLSHRQAALSTMRNTLQSLEITHKRSLSEKEKTDQRIKSLRRSQVGEEIIRSEIEEQERLQHSRDLLIEDERNIITWYTSEVFHQEKVLIDHKLRLELLVQRSWLG